MSDININENFLSYEVASTEDKKNICKLGRAISIPERVEILRLLQEKPIT